MLPAGCEIIAVNPHGKGSWSAGYKVEIESDGEELEYFLKVLLILQDNPTRSIAADNDRR